MTFMHHRVQDHIVLKSTVADHRQYWIHTSYHFNNTNTPVHVTPVIFMQIIHNRLPWIAYDGEIEVVIQMG